MFAKADRDRMPGQLRAALMDVLVRPPGMSREDLSALLDRWWRDALSRPRYPGPYPHPQDLA
jgi:hypothetical protein